MTRGAETALATAASGVFHRGDMLVVEGLCVLGMADDLILRIIYSLIKCCFQTFCLVDGLVAFGQPDRNTDVSRKREP